MTIIKTTLKSSLTHSLHDDFEFELALDALRLLNPRCGGGNMNRVLMRDPSPTV